MDKHMRNISYKGRSHHTATSFMSYRLRSVYFSNLQQACMSLRKRLAAAYTGNHVNVCDVLNIILVIAKYMDAKNASYLQLRYLHQDDVAR